MEAKFKFIPLNFNWVAIHPRPIGVIQVIGGAFFGSFPTIFYRYLLRKLFDKGYTIIALPFRFTFRHWSVAISLVKDQGELLEAISVEAQRLGYEYEIYEKPPISQPGKYFWLGHSLGCKYIALLELLTDLEEYLIAQGFVANFQTKEVRDVLGKCVTQEQCQEIWDRLQQVDLRAISLKNQPVLLMAPAITGIESAIPVKALADLVKRLGLDVKPTVEETHCLIKASNLFNLIGLMAFSEDNIARDTVHWLPDNLPHPPLKFWQLLGRKHLAPLGWRNGDTQLVNQVMQGIEVLKEKVESSPE